MIEEGRSRQKNAIRRKNLSKKDRGREKKKLSCGEDKWRNKAITKMEKSTDSDYEEFINEGLKSAERTTMKGRIVRKSLLKGNQEDFFDEALRKKSRLRKNATIEYQRRKKCNKKKEKFVERRSRKREEKNGHVERING